MLQDIIKLVVDNGIAVACFIAFIYFIFIDKKESNDLFRSTNEVLKQINETLVKMQVNLQQLNDRVDKLEKAEIRKD